VAALCLHVLLQGVGVGRETMCLRTGRGVGGVAVRKKLEAHSR